MSEAPNDKDELAARVWQLMFDYLMATNPRRSDALAKRGLTPNDSKALMSLEAATGRPIGELAREWQSDPSNATWIVDRLEKAGLVERHASASDRRVKLVMLTAHGAATQQALMAEFREPPENLSGLEIIELLALESVLKKLSGPGR